MGFETTISTDERSKTYALDRAATGTDISVSSVETNFEKLLSKILEALMPPEYL